MQLLSPPGLPQGSQGRRGGGGGGEGGVWPLEIEESILEAVGGDQLGSQLAASLDHRPLPQVGQQVGQSVALQENISNGNCKGPTQPLRPQNCLASDPDYD